MTEQIRDEQPDGVDGSGRLPSTVLTFDEFFRREYRRVLALAVVLSGRRDVAEELAQDAFVSAYRNWDKVTGYDDPAAWVRRVAVNLATSAFRRRASELRALARLSMWRKPPEEALGGDDEFWAVVRTLPPRQAQCVALRYLEDRSIQEIAGVLGVAEPTVRVHLHAGRRALAARLGEILEEEQ